MRDRKKMRFEDAMRARQANTVWPDPVINGRGVDALLWHGSPSATIVQKIGACICGAALVLGGVRFEFMARSSDSILIAIFGAFFLLVGARMCFKAFFPSHVQEHSAR
jgi:hypothetical protein